ncbi:hypothetical protein LCGC14_1588170 [marine sediment metagenome]|uniref:Holliday junction resolvase n=1 Tax=marine sediment metagenome TaxID=412755 RepID=A0A0F9IET0_9ZZZZ
MPNQRYNKGREKEYNICRRLKKDGFAVAQRTAGSHSPFDVIAINKETKTILLIQSKVSKTPKWNELAINRDWGWLNDEFRVEFRIE